MAKKEEVGVGGYTLVNQEKVDRALFGAPQPDGSRKGGIANEDGTYDNAKLLAEYDRMGGLIKKENDRVKTGSFYDFKKRKPREAPQVEFVFRVNGKEVFVPEGKELPGEVRAARILAAAGEADEAGRPKKGKKAKDEE